MCRFCTEHGEGEKWYLAASSYAADLQSDLRRRDYLTGFIEDFDTTRASAITYLGVTKRLPSPMRGLITGAVSRNMMEHHFGQPVPIEDCARIFDTATSIVRLPCLCRTHAGRPAEGVCLAVTTRPVDDILTEAFGNNPAFDGGPDVSSFDKLTKDEALAILDDCEKRGLMHSVWTFITPFIGAICNCSIPAGCMAMRIQLEFDTKVMWKGHYLAQVDEARCTGCRACVPACPFGALEVDRPRRLAIVDVARCYGCGTCRTNCPAGAMSIVDREPLIGSIIPAKVAW
jgi:Na+-translocating ferredoxin:NAD+ oxidoreductase RNF subunit RnfB